MNKKKVFLLVCSAANSMAAVTWRSQRKNPKRKRAVALWRLSRNRIIAAVAQP